MQLPWKWNKEQSILKIEKENNIIVFSVVYWLCYKPAKIIIY